MADTPWDVKQALEERDAGDGPEGSAFDALVTVTSAALSISLIDDNPYLTMGLAAVACTYVLKWCDIISGYKLHNELCFWLKIIEVTVCVAITTVFCCMDVV